jgi:outer membrane beta-barrel protein
MSYMTFLSHLIFFCFSFLFITQSLANEYDFSWLDSDKKIYVLQNRKFRKGGTFYIGGTLGRTLSGAFIDSNEANLNAGFFFSEDWGLEFTYTVAQGQTNKTHDAVNLQGAVAYYRKIDSAQSALLLWSPFYGKINTFNSIFYYDWMIGAGVANLSTSDNRNEFNLVVDKTLVKDAGLAGSWMTGIRFHINNNWSTRIDFRGYHLNADTFLKNQDTSRRWFHYYNVNLGLNYTF